MSGPRLVAPDRRADSNGGVTIDPTLVARFAHNLTQIVDTAAEHDHFGIALSGGPDSVALLLLCTAAMPGRISAATVDHQLRAESAEEAAWCAKLCDRLTLPHATLTPMRPITGNLQSEARKARYALLDGWAQEQSINWILTAHHADDQAETLMMRLNRGSGVAGLAGVRARNGKIVRPLLQWRRDELSQILAQAGIIALQDPSNINRAFDRVRTRQALADAPWIDTLSISRSASHLADSEAALQWSTEQLAATYIAHDQATNQIELSAPFDTLPRELGRRLISYALDLLDGAPAPRGDALDRLLALMCEREKAMIGDYLIVPDTKIGNVRWTIKAAPRRSSKGGQ